MRLQPLERMDKNEAILRGVAEYNRRQHELRTAFGSRTVDWDEDWGGEDCPWRKPDPDMERLRRMAHLTPIDPRDRRKAWWIDKVIRPTVIILSWGFMIGVVGFVGMMLVNISAGLPPMFNG